jgi:uncharacterized membrane protein YeaQ/YmgE (transglycosylase-associated protein family)
VGSVIRATWAHRPVEDEKVCKREPQSVPRRPLGKSEGTFETGSDSYPMSTASIFTAILAGIVVGALGRLIVPGRQAIGWILTFAVGLVGAVVGGFLAEGMDVDVWWQVLIFQVVVAAILVALVSMLVRGAVNKRSSRRTHT